MASNIPDFKCIRCYESRPLKVVGDCKHSFCAECLSTVLQSQKGDGNVFPCPTCQADCPVPSDGVEGLVDYMGEAADATLAAPKPGPEPDSQADVTEKCQDDNTGNALVAKCQVCQHNLKDVQAANLCLECDDLYMCKMCTTLHASKKATAQHKVIELQTNETEGGAVCAKHEILLKKYCQTCGKAVCKVCIFADHGDHAIEKLCDTISQNVVATKEILNTREDEFSKLLQAQNELRALHAIVRKVDKRDVLIKEIEDHAQKCIDAITAWKEGLKYQTKADFKVIQDISEQLARVTEEVDKVLEPFHRARRLLKTKQTDQVPDPAYLQQLITLQNDLVAVNIDFDTEPGMPGVLRKELQELEASDCRFTAEAIPGLGKIDKNTYRGQKECTEISTHTLQADSDDVFIPCVANLGNNLYAVAHPVRAGEVSNAIDIYELSGTLMTTLRDHFDGVYDMAATTDNKLAVLTNGTKRHRCTVKVFDPEDEYKLVSSTKEMLLQTPMSLAVGPDNQFAIHGENVEGKWTVCIVSKDGVVHRFSKDTRARGQKITWGGRFLFIKYMNSVDVHELRDSDSVFCHVKTWSSWFEGEMTDISATPWDGFVFTNIFYGHLELGIYFRSEDDRGNITWEGKLPTIRSDMQCADREARVSIRDDHIIVSHGKTIRVYELKPANAVE